MKFSKIKIVLVLSIAAVFIFCPTCKAQSDLSEGWEVNVMKNLQPPKKIMDAIGIKPGMVIGEVGAGRGRFTVYLAREVGAKGRKYANDIDKNAISYLSERVKNLVSKTLKQL